jgi:plasmid stabilization system protein ParE
MSLGSKPAENFIVFYYLVPDGVMISRVIHAARDWPAILMGGDR